MCMSLISICYGVGGYLTLALTLTLTLPLPRPLPLPPTPTPDQVLVLLPGGGIQTIDAYALRRLCRSPSNRPDELPPDLAPLEFAPLGNYAMSVRWSDGHQSLIPYRSFVEGWQPYAPGD